jgi:hypothetical protein
MDKNYILETLGAIWKEESLSTLTHHIIENTFVLEAMEPYPGYHHAGPMDNQSRLNHVFLVLKRDLSTEQLIRHTQKIKRLFGLKFDATPAEITIFNTKYDAIRLRDYEGLEALAEIMALYRDEGVGFMKQRNIQGKGIIKVLKYLVLNQLNEEVYQDAEDPNTLFFEVPCQMNWKLFEKVTQGVKMNTPDRNFDAALAILYRKRGIVDLVRVYDEQMNEEKMNEIRKRYSSELARYV